MHDDWGNVYQTASLAPLQVAMLPTDFILKALFVFTHQLKISLDVLLQSLSMSHLR